MVRFKERNDLRIVKRRKEMKTSEFRQAIINLGFDFKETDEYILIDGFIGVFKKAQRINFLTYVMYGYEKTKLLKLAIEYTETPIEEREEEKKYYFKFCDKLGKQDKKRYLN